MTLHCQATWHPNSSGDLTSKSSECNSETKLSSIFSRYRFWHAIQRLESLLWIGILNQHILCHRTCMPQRVQDHPWHINGRILCVTRPWRLAALYHAFRPVCYFPRFHKRKMYILELSADSYLEISSFRWLCQWWPLTPQGNTWMDIVFIQSINIRRGT